MPIKKLNRKLRFEGCLVGLAIGDSLGAPIEWAKPGKFKKITKMRASKTHNLKKGEWTDDTAMALATANSLIYHGFDAKDQLTNYLAWYRSGKFSMNGKCVGIGRTTRESLEWFEGHPHQIVAVQGDPNLAGNGSIMRIAPVSMYATTLTKAGHLAILNSATTHSNPLCTGAAELFSKMIFLALKGKTKKEIFDWAEKEVMKQDFKSAELIQIFKKKTYKNNPPFIKASGYVIKSLEAALWAFYKTRSFKAGALKAVNLGDDADTVGALYGQLAGAYYGIDAIPKQWKADLKSIQQISKYAECLYIQNVNAK